MPVFNSRGLNIRITANPWAKKCHSQRGGGCISDAHLKLTEKDDGVIELWQDRQKIIDTHGQTLVLAHMIYNSFEIGISAYNEKDKPGTLYVDDVSISDQPMND